MKTTKRILELKSKLLFNQELGNVTRVKLLKSELNHLINKETEKDNLK
jgi:hypothetical protein